MSGPGWRVVTVGREYGSGGAAIGAALARRLDYELLDRALIGRIAEGARIDPELAERFDEHVDRWAARLMRALRYGTFEAVTPVAPDSILDAERMQALTAALIEKAAEAGRCVIVGRAAQCVLRERRDAFHVFVYAPYGDRVRRLRARLGPDADVERLIDEMDREREAYVRRHFGCDWLDRHLYHLMLDASLGEEAAVATIMAALAVASPAVP